MSALSRFVGEGLLDAERRVATLTSPLPVDEPRVVAQFESSVAFGFVARIVDHVARAYESSLLIARGDGAIRAWWTGRPWRWQRFAGGAILVIAALTYLGLYLLQRSPVGWLWFLLPGLALLVGGLSIAASGALAGRTRA